uniref:RNase H type-1 domain-containing protein n=1 Tax=Quercus lobata TaxID=97700 RepID=A0A7N2M6W5_QUELO
MAVIIRNEKDEVMGAKSAKGPWVTDSLEAEALACRTALEFAVDIGLSDIVIEGDCVQVINAIKADRGNLSQLGHVIEDIQVLISGLRWVKVRWVKRSANLVAHSLAWYAKNISNDVIWLEDDPPPTLEPLFHDCLAIME